MRLAALALHDPADELDGSWTREQLVEMNARFAAALEQAFLQGWEHRERARREIKLPPTLGPRWAPPLTRQIQEGLWRTSSRSRRVSASSRPKASRSAVTHACGRDRQAGPRPATAPGPQPAARAARQGGRRTSALRLPSSPRYRPVYAAPRRLQFGRSTMSAGPR